ncbi:hypothetical protein KEM52_003891, partial [Ascosphaera acerosa]
MVFRRALNPPGSFLNVPQTVGDERIDDFRLYLLHTVLLAFELRLPPVPSPQTLYAIDWVAGIGDLRIPTRSAQLDAIAWQISAWRDTDGSGQIGRGRVRA